METELPIFEFSVDRITDCGFFIEEAITPNEQTMQIGYGMNFVFDVAESWIMYNIRADFKHIDTNIVFMSGTVLTRFKITNLGSFLDENEEIIFPANSLETLFGIAFGHLRGIFAKNISGTKFRYLYIPVIDPAPLFNDLLEMNIEKMKQVKEKERFILPKEEDKKDSPMVANPRSRKIQKRHTL